MTAYRSSSYSGLALIDNRTAASRYWHGEKEQSAGRGRREKHPSHHRPVPGKAGPGGGQRGQRRGGSAEDPPGRLPAGPAGSRSCRAWTAWRCCARCASINKKLKVLIITAHGTIENAVEAMKLGAVDFIQKPFTPDEIRGFVAKALARTEGFLNRLRQEPQPGRGGSWWRACWPAEPAGALPVPAREAKARGLDYEGCIEQAKAAVEAYDFDSAAAWAQQAVALDTARAEAYNLLGVLLRAPRRPAGGAALLPRRPGPGPHLQAGLEQPQPLHPDLAGRPPRSGGGHRNQGEEQTRLNRRPHSSSRR